MSKPSKPAPGQPRVPVLLFFASAGCVPCMALKMRGTLDRIAKEFGVELVTLELEDDDDVQGTASTTSVAC